MVDEEIEKAILYHIIFGKEEFNLSEKDFAYATNRQIIKAINELKAEKEEVSMITVRDKIDKNSIKILEYISNLGNYIYGNMPETSYRILKNNSKKRELYRICTEIQKQVEKTEDIDTYIEKIIKHLQKVEMETESEESFVEVVAKTADLIEKSVEKKEDYSLYTGFFDLDNITDGLHKGELTIIGARPGVGKTTFALQIANRIANYHKNVSIVSLEMSDVQIIQKLIAKNTKINSRKIRNGDLTKNDLEKIALQCIELSDIPLNIITKINTIQQIELHTRRMKNKNKLDLLIIDYLQLVRNAGSFKNREQEVADISRTLKLLSLELEIPIIALCQLNRNASRSEPTLADIRESGAIEQDADNVIFLYQENEENNIVTVDLQKQRAGNIGKINLKFNKVYSEFKNLVR